MAGRQSLEINEEQVKAWVIATKRDGISWASLSRASGFSAPLIKGRVARFLETNPGFLETLVAAAPPADDQMDDPELVVTAAVEAPVVDEVAPLAAAPEPVADLPSTEVAVQQELARRRARDLHQKAQMVVAAQELPSPAPVLARKQYSPPRVTAFGELFKVGTVNAMPVAQMVGKLVKELNSIPGVTASFDFSYRMSVRQ